MARTAPTRSFPEAPDRATLAGAPSALAPPVRRDPAPAAPKACEACLECTGS